MSASGLEKLLTVDLLSWVDTRSSLVFLMTLLSGILWTSSRRKHNLPPGPTVWPILGNLPQVINQMRKHRSQFKMFQHFSELYGTVFSIRMGPKDMVILTDYDSIKEVMYTNAADFINRPMDRFHEEFTHENGMLFANGKKWEEIRRFSVVALRDFGVGKKSLECIIQNEAEIVCEQMSKEKEPFYPKPFMSLSVANILFSIIFGDRFDYDDPDFRAVLGKMDYMATTVGPTMIERYLPFLRYLPIDTSMKKVLRNRSELEQYTYKKIEEHRETFDPKITRDYIDLYLKVSEEGHKYTTLTEPHIFQTILDLYFAGAETTSTSLDWLILYLVVHPDVQDNIQKEIDKVVGQSRKVSLQDKNSMPYTVAALQELQRICNVAPIAIPHCSVKDTQLNGFFIPADTIILPQTLSVHLDPKHFPEPSKFKPERWLDDKNNLIKDEHFLPFGMGPRKCAGENLAKMELFLFATNFLQHYNFTLGPGKPKPTTEGTNTGITLQAKPYSILVLPRN